MPMIKICGLRDLACAAACVEAGVEFIGLNFVPSSKRRVTLGEARRLIGAIGDIEPIGVVMDPRVDDALYVAGTLGLGGIQLHGAEPPEVCAEIRAEGYRVIKALDAGRLHLAEAYAPYVDALLIDGRIPGSGVPWDWDGVRGPNHAGAPLWLAGGLEPDNVAAAIQAAAPSLVDVASGVESDGQMTPERVAAFAAAARGGRS